MFVEKWPLPLLIICLCSNNAQDQKSEFIKTAQDSSLFKIKILFFSPRIMRSYSRVLIAGRLYFLKKIEKYFKENRNLTLTQISNF